MVKNLQRFFQNEASGGVILIAAALLAMLLANMNVTHAGYEAFLNVPVDVRMGPFDINKNLLLWVNDALMAVFFLLIGLEVKREIMIGSLANIQQAAFPVIAALGGMVAPALFYLALNYSDPVIREGWAIPVATDIAFALGVLALLGKRVPPGLKVFLMALAVIDDLGAIIIIALFYSHDLSMISLGMAAMAVAALVLLNLLNVRRTGIYILVGVILWGAILKSGIHATLAGVIVGFLIPLQESKGHSPARELARILNPWVAFLILPLFAFANAGISLAGISEQGFRSLLVPGIMVGLFIGKPSGIVLFCWLALRLKLAALPKGVSFPDIMALSVLCGIGFTMSIFIASLAFGDIDIALMTWAKLGILMGSLISAVAGFTILRLRLSTAKA